MKKGFSLIEVLVAASILSVVILGVMRVNDNLLNVEQGFIQSQDSMEVLGNAKLFMGHQLSCIATFKQAKKKRFDGKPYIPLIGEIESIRNFEDNNFLSLGEKYGKVELTGLSFQPRKGYFEGKEFNNERGIIDLMIHMRGVGKLKRPRFKRLPVWVYANKKLNEAAEIQYCDSSRSDMVNFITESVMARVCQSLDAALDPDSKLCVFGSDQEKRAAVKKAERLQTSSKSREVSSQSSKSTVDDEMVLMYLMKTMLEETEKKKGD